MSINYIPNDPSSAGAIPMRVITPRPDRPGNRAQFDIAGAVAEGRFNVGTPEFLYWQCREALLATIETWEGIEGSLATWEDDDVLEVFPDDGDDLNAYYDRARGGRPERVSFFHGKAGAKTYFSGASTDVVAHELGHALLDAIRPDFWDSNRFEVNTLHEAFGDCMAIIVALHDKATRQAVVPTVATTNAVESTAEELAEAIKKAFPGHNAGAARRARNDFQWGPRDSIPFGGGPGTLIYEEHSFGQVFSGCFYDVVVNIFQGMSSQSEANLLQATQTAAKLLIGAVRQAPQRAQYFREVGRLMILIDEQDNGAANRDAIRDAFQRHNVALGSSLTLAPQATLGAAAAPAGRGAAAAAQPPELTPTAKRNLLDVIGAETRKLAVTAVNLVGAPLQEAIHERLVSLDAIHKDLRGVVARAPQVALIGRTRDALAIVGHVSNGGVTDRDVESYVQSLVEHGRIMFATRAAARGGGRGGRSAVAGPQKLPSGVTHVVREVRGQKELVRLRFACRGH